MSTSPRKIINCSGLTKKESELFTLLRETVELYSPDTVLRVAGGWVRDHLLRLPSDDIDIAVDNMSGENFAKLFIKHVGDAKLTTIQANPEQSKHLETAIINFNGQSIDFANLRKESYAKSRIPTTEIGTPYEDATRRDLTINSLFLNLNTMEIEDYIGGIDDLNNKIARTPIDPIQTFIDDPLRILRIVRFASKYNLGISYAILNATHDPKVQKALKTKVSAERLWKEVAGQYTSNKWKPGFLNGKNFRSAVILAWRMQLLPFLFDIKELPASILSLYDFNYDPESVLVQNLTALWINKTDLKIKKCIERLKVQNNIAQRVLNLNKYTTLDNNISDAELRFMITNIGKDWQLAADLSILINNQPPILKSRMQQLVDEMGGVTAKLPVTGNDLKEIGIEPGPEMGEILSRIKHKWYENIKLTKEEALEIAKNHAV